MSIEPNISLDFRIYDIAASLIEMLPDDQFRTTKHFYRKSNIS